MYLSVCTNGVSRDRHTSPKSVCLGTGAEWHNQGIQCLEAYTQGINFYYDYGIDVGAESICHYCLLTDMFILRLQSFIHSQIGTEIYDVARTTMLCNSSYDYSYHSLWNNGECAARHGSPTRVSAI